MTNFTDSHLTALKDYDYCGNDDTDSVQLWDGLTNEKFAELHKKHDLAYPNSPEDLDCRKRLVDVWCSGCKSVSMELQQDKHGRDLCPTCINK